MIALDLGPEGLACLLCSCMSDAIGFAGEKEACAGSSAEEEEGGALMLGVGLR